MRFLKFFSAPGESGTDWFFDDHTYPVYNGGLVIGFASRNSISNLVEVIINVGSELGLALDSLDSNESSQFVIRLDTATQQARAYIYKEKHHGLPPKAEHVRLYSAGWIDI